MQVCVHDYVIQIKIYFSMHSKVFGNCFSKYLKKSNFENKQV